MKREIILMLILLLPPVPLFASEQIVFTGVPRIKVSEGGVERTPEQVSDQKAKQLKCTITEMDGKYYWATRDNLELIRVQSGAYSTFFATNGAGYVRVIDPNKKDVASLAGNTEAEFDYVEHMLLGLRSVTYYGDSK